MAPPAPLQRPVAGPGSRRRLVWAGLGLVAIVLILVLVSAALISNANHTAAARITAAVAALQSTQATDRQQIATSAALATLTVLVTDTNPTLQAVSSTTATPQGTLAGSARPENVQSTIEATETPWASIPRTATQTPWASIPHTATATTPPAATIPLTEWRMTYFTRAPYGCKFYDQPCWIGKNSSKLTEVEGTDLILSVQNGIYIDPNWPNPHLVFWHNFPTCNIGEVTVAIDQNFWQPQRHDSINVNSQPARPWVEQSIDLNGLKGKTIFVKFSQAIKFVKVYRSQNPIGCEWNLQAIQIVPSYPSP